MSLSSPEDDGTVAGQTSSNNEDECNKLAKNTSYTKKQTDSTQHSWLLQQPEQQLHITTSYCHNNHYNHKENAATEWLLQLGHKQANK